MDSPLNKIKLTLKVTKLYIPGKIIVHHCVVQHIMLCYSIYICDMAWNLITINKLHLTEVRDHIDFNAFRNCKAKFHMGSSCPEIIIQIELFELVQLIENRQVLNLGKTRMRPLGNTPETAVNGLLEPITGLCTQSAESQFPHDKRPLFYTGQKCHSEQK